MKSRASMLQPIRHAFVRVGKAFKHGWDSRAKAKRLLRGFIGLLIPFSLVGFVILGIDIVQTQYGLHRNPFLDVLMEVWALLTVTIFMAIFIVYFLRLLNWLRTYGQAFWNEETAPHLQGRRSDDDRPRVNRPLSDAKFKFLEWTVLSLLIWLTFITFVIAALAVSSIIGWGFPDFAPTLREPAVQFLEQVPVIGQIIGFEYYPGDGPLGTVSYFVGAFPAAIAIRNLVYVFEYIDEFDTTEDESYFRVVLVACAVVLTLVMVVAALVMIVFIIHEVFGI